MNGMALVVTLLLLGACSAMGAGLMLVTIPERLAGSSYRHSVAALNAADAALEVAARELSTIGNWDQILAGTVRSRFVDGPPSGTRNISRGGLIDLAVLTNVLTCDRATPCSDARVHQRTIERPWGTNNPRWRLFLHLNLAAIQTVPDFSDSYVVVWIGDDSAEADGDPLIDGGAASGAGRSIVRARAETFGPGETRRAIEADLVRQEGVHVKSWRTVTPVVP